MTYPIPKRAAAGTQISATEWNKMVDLVAMLASMKGEAPVRIRTGSGGTVIGLDGPQRRWDATIVAVNGGAGPGLASAFTYNVRLLDRRETGAGGPGLLSGLTPKWRPAREANVEIWPAAVGDPCSVLFWPSPTVGQPPVVMLVLEPGSEQVARGVCGS